MTDDVSFYNKQRCVFFDWMIFYTINLFLKGNKHFRIIYCYEDALRETILPNFFLLVSNYSSIFATKLG